MKLPKKLKILGKMFKIEYFEFNDRVQLNDYIGNASLTKQLLQIDNSVPLELQTSTLIHEVIHIISDMLGLEFNERLVKQLEMAAYQILNDNKLLKE